jgi:adenosylhomocysteinase
MTTVRTDRPTADTPDVRDLKLADEGRRRTEWAERSMPVLRQIKERFAKERPLAGRKLAACLHVTTETANLAVTLQAGGADVALCASNPLSTQDDVAAHLVRDHGIKVFAVRGVDRDGYYEHIRRALAHESEVTMDDGADLVGALHMIALERLDDLAPPVRRWVEGLSAAQRKALVAKVIGSTEETTTGVIRLKAMAADGTLRVPVVAVNDSATKHLFDNHYGTGQSAIDGIIRATNVLLAGQNIVVIGYGDCGRGVANRADGLGASVIVVEVDPVRALSAVMDGYRVMTAADASRVGDIFITVTGNKHVLRMEHFDVMKDGVILANAGHFDIELDLAALRAASVARRGVRNNLDEFELPDGRRLLVAAEGRLVNLGAAEGHPADVMDMSFSNQALAAEYLALNVDDLEAKIYTLPPEIDAEVARIKLEQMGAGLDVLTDEQVAYLSGWQEGT